MKLSDAAHVFLSTKRFEGFSPHTVKAYKFQYSKFIEDVGDIDIADVTMQLLRDHIAHNSHLKSSSLGHKVRSLKSFFSWLTDEEYISKNPTVKLREPKMDQRIPKALNIEQVELLRDSCKSDFEHALIEFFFATGCRLSEVQGLNRADVNFRTNSVMVMGKGSKQRECYFGARCSIWLKRYLDGRTDDEEALFVTQNAPHRIGHHHLWFTFKKVAERCGLHDKVSPHVLRHTLATLVLDNGAPLHIVQSLLGHSKPEVTLLYTKLSGKARKQAYDRYFTQ